MSIAATTSAARGCIRYFMCEKMLQNAISVEGGTGVLQIGPSFNGFEFPVKD
jgi:hypothetical protein